MRPSVAESDHEPTADTEWQEAHRVDAVFAAAQLTLSLMITKYPHRGHATYHAVILRFGERPVAVVEFEVPLPAATWEIRASGLWADHICETPMDHWSYGLEAFGLALDDAEELLGSALGERVPIGWELEFEARAPAHFTAPDRYGQIGVMHGLLLEKHSSTEIDGVAVRSHWWGRSPPSRVDVGEVPTGPPALVLPTIGGQWSMTADDVGASSVFTARRPTGGVAASLE
jgi:hypothetical protein